MPATKRILVVCPSFPAPESGAEQMDRADGVRQLVRLGYEVVVIAKAVAWANSELIERTAREMGVRVVLVPYKYSNRNLTAHERLLKFFGKFRNPLYFDGAAYEYAEPSIRAAVAHELQNFKPDIVWFEYTYLWPLYKEVRKAGVPIVVRSANFEPSHFLQEHGPSLFNYFRYIPKFFSELITIRSSDLLFAITPGEEMRYKRLGARSTAVLPLRSLPRFIALPRPAIDAREPLHVFYMGSSYKVAHNKAAAEFVIGVIAPLVESMAPRRFVFHILGGKLPDELQKKCDGVRVLHEGYVPNLDAFLQGMDIALVPSLMGAGMQQKVFEPLARGIPTLTSRRAIAGYPLTAGVEYMTAHTMGEFVAALLSLQDVEKRRTLTARASEQTAKLFSQEALDSIVTHAILEALS